MSKKTYVEAIEYVLDSELDARSDLICFRPGARRALEEADRDVPLPRMGAHSFSVALGAALQGMHPVLDLRQESGAAEFLKEALIGLPGNVSPAITVIACAEEGMDALPGAYVFAPQTPRQAAGFMRSALKMNRLTLMLVDQSLFAEEDDIPEDRGFTLLPLDGDEAFAEADGTPSEARIDEEDAYDEAEAEEVCVITVDEEAACDEAENEPVQVIHCADAEPGADEPEDEPEQMIHCADAEPGADEPEDAPARAESGTVPVRREPVFCATRQTGCSLQALNDLCKLLDMDEETLVERCAGHVLPVYGGFELHCETDAPEGEAAFLPPEEEAAAIWLGSDRLTIAYDPSRMKHEEAAGLLRAVKRVVEKPQLLIYDKEYDEP